MKTVQKVIKRINSPNRFGFFDMKKIKIIDDQIDDQLKKDKEFGILNQQIKQFSQYKGDIPFSYLTRTLSLILDLDIQKQKKLKGLSYYMDLTNSIHNKKEMFKDMQD